MKIATWNINGFAARLDFLKRWLQDRQPDVVGLQELKLIDDAFPHEEFRELGYEAITHGQKAWNGVAVLSRLPLEILQTGLPGHEEAGARLLTVMVDGDLEFTTVYCPNGKSVEHADYAAKLAWFDGLIEYWQSRDGANAVLCGDFNIVHTALDSWRGAAADGDIFHTQEERARLQAVLDLGLNDLYRDRHPDEQTFSWWDYRGGSFHRGHGLRIDLILGSDAVRDSLLQVATDRDYRKKQDGMTASDHAPVIAELA
jgi:exodeoxyribonuclease-3